MKRWLAIVVAGGLVVGAVLVRRALDGDTGGGDGDELALVCGAELAPVCDGLAAGDDRLRVAVEDASVTATRVATGELDLDGGAWLVAAPWPAIAAAGTGSDADEFPDLAGSGVLAESPAVLVARRDRMEAIAATCGEPTWACIGERAGAPWTELGGQATWGRVEVALPAAGTAAGAVTIDQAVASRVGRTDFAVNDLDDDPATSAWFDRLASQSQANQRDDLSPLQQFLRVPGSLGVVGALGAEADTEIGRASSRDALITVVPEPRATAQVRLWSTDADAVREALDRIGPERLATLLADSGWDSTGEERAAGAGTMVSEDGGPYPEAGLPNAGVMSAVITRWENLR
jgi:hypothetical protein